MEQKKEHPEYQYLNLCRKILDKGVKQTDKGTGVVTHSLFGKQMCFDLSEGFPLLTTKKVYWKGLLYELYWFLSGQTNIKYLVDNNVHIWDDYPYKVYRKLMDKHTTFHQAVAATGRLSSSYPNLQNIPIRTPLGRRIRRAFVAGAPDVVLVSADYSQIELRILADVAGDAHLKEAFAAGRDIHRDSAALVLRKDPADVTADERSMAKMVNFGIAYGMSDFGLSTRAGISRQEAQEFINSYFATYSGISYYMLHIKESARERGFVTTLLGRRRPIPELEARNPSLRAAGERMAINMPIQGTAADIIKIAMIRLAARLRDEGFRARMLLQVHDELLLEVPRDEVARLAPGVRETMESAMPLDVPLTVDVKVGDDWESMTPLRFPPRLPGCCGSTAIPT